MTKHDLFAAPTLATLQLGAGFDEDTGRMTLVRSGTSESMIVNFRTPVPSRVQLYESVLATSPVLTTSNAVALAAGTNAAAQAGQEQS